MKELDELLVGVEPPRNIRQSETRTALKYEAADLQRPNGLNSMKKQEGSLLAIGQIQASLLDNRVPARA